ncbi:MAG: hypothetical protein LBC17_00960, partial [Lactobacillaceae bacterium]|nr:hypothetical protein [Lactobacillaceae bacterium]
MITNDINNFKNFKDDIEKITEYQKLIEIFLTTKDIKKLIQTARLLIENKNKLKTISVNLDLSSLSWMNHLIQRIFEIKKIGKISIIDNSIRFDLLNNFEFN